MLIFTAQKLNNFAIFLFMFYFSFLSFSQQINAQKITVVNPSFELPGTGKVKGFDGHCSDPSWKVLVDIPGWNVDSPDSTQRDSGVEKDTPTDGSYRGFLMGGDSAIYQTLDRRVLEDDNIVLTVDALNIWAAPSFKMQLYYINEKSERVPIVTEIKQLTSGMAPYSISFKASEHQEAKGFQIGILLDNVSDSASWIGIDNVRLINDIPGFTAIESFDYPSGTSLDTLAGNGGSGWAGTWDLFDGNSEVMTVMNTGFDYNDLSYPVSHTATFFKGANPTAWGSQRYGRYLAQRWPNEKGKVYWLSTLYELQDYTTSGWAMVSLFDSASEKAGVGHEWGNDSIGVGVYNTAGHSSFTASDGPQWLVAEVYMSGDTLSNVYLWVTPDPTGAEPDTNNANAKGRWNLVNGFNRVAVHWGGEGVGMTMAVDEIRLGTSWADVSTPVTAVERNNNELPDKYALSQNYPNPFNPSTKISFKIKNAGFVRLNVYNILGQHICTLVNENLNAGNYEKVFNASGLTSGLYFYRLEAGNKVFVNKMMLLK